MAKKSSSGATRPVNTFDKPLSIEDRQAWVVAVSVAKLPAGAFKVATMLAGHHNTKTGQCNPSHATVAAETGLSWDSVRRNIRALIASGFIEAMADFRGNGGKSSNRYRLTMPGTVAPVKRARSEKNPAKVAFKPTPLGNPAQWGADHLGNPAQGGLGNPAQGVLGNPAQCIRTENLEPATQNREKEINSFSDEKEMVEPVKKITPKQVADTAPAAPSGLRPDRDGRPGSVFMGTELEVSIPASTPPAQPEGAVPAPAAPDGLRPAQDVDLELERKLAEAPRMRHLQILRDHQDKMEFRRMAAQFGFKLPADDIAPAGPAVPAAPELLPGLAFATNDEVDPDLVSRV